MVNSKKKDILERYRSLLESNLVLSDDLIHWLKDKKALPEFVFDDIKVGKHFFFLTVIFYSFCFNRHSRQQEKKIKNL
jgi:hypothetical protein